ncbi:CAZyme family GT90 [Penicillium robsamsonii]|uniref:CAZyme family GT90 n=1 Tax=Penicillium robsamsonii TaxID=1792511 RepID=UPI0025498446|nr:CAZyme family GT90 [Penicillium robsamsonii]KAJ5817629.1 CAZyme family GT90 [Penicillium robsamsonii]
MTASFPIRPRCLPLLCVVTAFCFIAIIAVWFGMNSDRKYIHPILTQLIPAGHCTCESSTIFQCSTCLTCYEPGPQADTSASWSFEYTRDGRNEALSQNQCKAAFPGLFEDVARGSKFWSSHGRLSSAELDVITIQHGMARAFIADGQLYVVEARPKNEDHRRKILGTLSSIHRALAADQERASRRHFEFVFSVEDRVDDVTNSEWPVWVFSRTPTEEGVWLMPDFSFWAWDNPDNYMGPYDQVVQRIERMDIIPWLEKTPKLVWRGKPSFAPKLRHALMEAARDKSWGDVKEVDWDTGFNVLGMEDHCHYMFIAHVEGRSYSASLKYRQACNSVIIAHKPQFIQHHHYLLVADGPNQNYVEVERDFSDLSEKMDTLVSNTEVAKRIAHNSVTTFRERYLTPAAEACYWRSLFDGYAGVWNGTVEQSSETMDRERGLRYESFVLLESLKMYEFEAAMTGQWQAAL